ncbi:hypothetical protein VPNG_04042 [Cytospora leucostoma]|uniref:Uncharacterized protein n=1 Tax=Cytospora leucostoma TaxID=1230097 RepID=A0A423XDA8_9PEZI|nr:hypothetical protein VPNG_04042 [Cytospora leucostoma]
MELSWNDENLKEDDVKDYISGNNARPSVDDTPFTPKDEQCGIWHEAPNSKCHASFGDQGTTASVGAFGQLLQFSDYLGIGTTGMFSADHKETDEPYFVLDRL